MATQRDGDGGAGPYEDSKTLTPNEQDQAAKHSSPPALVIHEIVRKDGEDELSQTPSAVGWSALAAGLSMGFSFLALATVQSALPEEPWRRLVDRFGYSIGFVIVGLGKCSRCPAVGTRFPREKPRSGVFSRF